MTTTRRGDNTRQPDRSTTPGAGRVDDLDPADEVVRLRKALAALWDECEHMGYWIRFSVRELMVKPALGIGPGKFIDPDEPFTCDACGKTVAEHGPTLECRGGDRG